MKIILILTAAILFPASSNASSAKNIKVHVEIDYGPANKETQQKTVVVPEGSTVLDALLKVAPADQGMVCCTKNDVESIGGVKCDPESESWWLYEINGHMGPVSAFRLILVDGDRIRWYYSKLGTIAEKPAIDYKESRVKGGLKISGRVFTHADLPDLADYNIHKNVEACAMGAKPHPCKRSYKEGKLSHAVVWLESVSQGKSWGSQSNKSIVLDQKACTFDPHLIVARQWSELEIRNSDAVRHTVHAYDQKKKTVFNMAMASRKSGSRIKLEQPGILDIQCDAGHRWMQAHVFVAQNPYYAVTDEDGIFNLMDVPPGDYTLHVWHDLFGDKTQPIDVKEVPLAPLEFEFKAEDLKKIKT